MLKIKQKLYSECGASITFALLLFLVCAVTGSLILVAGTAASGRFSRAAKMDQQYYSVNSAASLLIDEFGKSCTVVNTVITETVRDQDGSPVTDTGTGGVTTSSAIYLDGNLINSSSASLAADAAKALADAALVSPDDSSSEPAAARPILTRQLTLIVKDDQKEYQSLQAAVNETLTADGTLQLEIIGTDPENTNYSYTLLLLFEADSSSETTSRTVESAPQNASGSSYTITTTTTEVTTTTVSWKLSEIRTLGAD